MRQEKGKLMQTIQISVAEANQEQREDDQLHHLYRQHAFDLTCEEAWNAQAYLQARTLPLDGAHRVGVGYVAPGASQQYGEWMRRWEDRLLFPLLAPDGAWTGYAGRLIHGWQGCRDAAAHQKFLHGSGLEPWIKIGQAGWFWEPLCLSTTDPIIIVQGPFDRLAILATGDFQPEEVIALVGSTVQPTWLSKVSAVLFALGSERDGKDASKRTRQHLAWRHVPVEVCRMTSHGGTWSERWHRYGADGLEALYAHHALLAHGL